MQLRLTVPGDIAKFEAAMATVAVWNIAGDFWNAMKLRVNGNNTLIKSLAAAIKGVSVSAAIPDNAPIWELEIIDQLNAAEAGQDWERLTDITRRIPLRHLGDPLFTQAALGLHCLDRGELLKVCGRPKDWMHAHLYLEPLTLEAALRLAFDSDDALLHFAALERLLVRENRTALSSEASDALERLFIALAEDHAAWPRWLGMFNRYPVRAPHIQDALGRALASCDEPALFAYVDSISLSPSDVEGRSTVSRCLSSFREMADENLRQTMWRHAFRRWTEWNFGDEERLTDLGRCALDYAVVGWLAEGQDKEQLTNPEEQFGEGLRLLDVEWHGSLTTGQARFVRLLSRYQPFAHAQRVIAEDAGWLPPDKAYLPPQADEFILARWWARHRTSAHEG
jgi:hypothetical protein